MKSQVIIGTRGSALALWQAEQVRQKIALQFSETNPVINIIKTKGDRILNVPLAKIADKGLFTKELETALLNGKIDMAVHSLKDLPVMIPAGIKLAAVLERGEVRDVLITSDHRKLHELTTEDVIGTSSLRRKAQLLHYNPSYKIVDIRGNIETRIRKMKDGYCTALILAGAGIIRLNKKDLITEYMDTHQIVPAVCQGIIGIETRENDSFIESLTKKINHPLTWLAADAERAFLREIEGGCQVPLGCFSTLDENKFTIYGFISGIEGNPMISKEYSASIDEAVTAARQLARYLLDNGGHEIMNEIRTPHE